MSFICMNLGVYIDLLGLNMSMKGKIIVIFTMCTCTFRKQAITVKNDRIVKNVMYDFRWLKIAFSEINKFLQCEIQIHPKTINAHFI